MLAGASEYRYHAEWRTTRDNGKFSKMIEFGAQLPKLRRRLKQDLALPGLPKPKVLAVIVTLLEETLIRVGNEEYARANRSYGVDDATKQAYEVSERRARVLQLSWQERPPA